MVRLALMTVGIVFLYVGFLWLSIVGLVLLMLAGLLTSRPWTRLGNVIHWLVCICAFVFLVLSYSSGVYRPSLEGLAAGWLAVTASAFGDWRESGKVSRVS